jgi:hypothetical protein
MGMVYREQYNTKGKKNTAKAMVLSCPEAHEE